MFSWVLKILPKLDEPTLRKMERTLSSRMARVAKGFGKGLMNVMKGGGVVGVALALIDKMLNPIKEVQEAIERTLKTGDDIDTNSKQFGTTSGELRKLIQFAEGSGLEQDGLFTMMQKYMGSIAEAKADPTKHSAVRAYANDTNIAASFFEFIQNLNKMNANDRTLAQMEVFGEKIILKQAELIQNATPERIIKAGLNRFKTEDITKALTKTAGLNERKEIGESILGTADIINKSRVMNNGMIDSMLESQRLEKQKEDQRIQNYRNINAITQTVNKIFLKLEELTFKIGEFINFLTPFVNQAMEVINFKSFNKAMIYLFGRGRKD